MSFYDGLEEVIGLKNETSFSNGHRVKGKDVKPKICHRRSGSFGTYYCDGGECVAWVQVSYWNEQDGKIVNSVWFGCMDVLKSLYIVSEGDEESLGNLLENNK